MSYLALYRAFRPKTFNEIIGQDHIVKTLVNQINTDRIGHAYLFCGARGTGKTTMAKVFARAINCLSPENGSPCGKCEVCKALESSTNLDITEMDAASNNKVENVRDIREKIQYPPVAGKYKVYIIDEVHMLTTEAFNALLKTLEEPPAHAVFILATTEVHKIPATILSRCLRFDFKLIPTPKIAEFISEIYDELGKKYQPEAVGLIAKAGEGSVRDALSIADICLSFSDGALTYDDVLEVLGTSDRSKIEELIKNIFTGETGKVLSVVDELCMRGKSVSVLNRDVCGVLRDLLIIKTCNNASQILGMPEDKLSELKNISQIADVHGVLRAIEIFSNVESELKYSTHPKIVFETAAVKAGLPQADYNIDALISRISKLEKALTDGAFKKAENTAENNATVERKAAETVTETSMTKDEKIDKKSAYNAVNAPKDDFSGGVDDDLSSFIAEAEKSGYYGEEETESSVKIQKRATAKEVVKTTAKETADEENKANQVSFVNLDGDATEKQSNSDGVKSKIDSSNGKITWGAVLKKLRADKEIMLWVACQDVTAMQDGSTVVICAPGENEYSLLSRDENIQKLNKYVQAEGAKNVRIVKDVTELEKREYADEQVRAVKDFFNGETVDVKD